MNPLPLSHQREDSCISLKASNEFSIVHGRTKTESSIPFVSYESRRSICNLRCFTKGDAKISSSCIGVASHHTKVERSFLVLSKVDEQK